MDLSEFQRPPKNIYAFNALRRKTPLNTPLGKMHVELYMDNNKPPDTKMLKLAEEFVEYAQSHIDYILDIMYGAYRHWVTIKVDPGWFPYLDVPADLKREQMSGYCEVRLFVDRHLKGWAKPYDTGIWLFPKWDNGETLQLYLRDAAIFSATESPLKLENGVLRFPKDKPAARTSTQADKRDSGFRKMPPLSLGMVQNACRRKEPAETPLGKCEVELHMPADKQPPDNEMLKLSAKLVEFTRVKSEQIRDIMFGAYRQWLALDEEPEEEVPRKLTKDQVRVYCEVRSVVTRWGKRYDTEIWLLPKWGQEHNLILKCRDGVIVTANEQPFKLEKGVLKLLDDESGEIESEGLVGSFLKGVSKVMESIEAHQERKREEGEQVQHPVFGRLIRADSNELVTFREFPFMRQFGNPDPRAADGKSSFSHLEKDERQVVENWKTSTAKLAAIGNRGPVSECLHSLGVFDLSVAVPEEGLPSPAQAAAFSKFMAEEKTICANLLNAMIRYYHFLRETAPQMFDWIEEEDLVEKPDTTSFAKLADFLSLHVRREAANGVATLQFHFSPIWDMEHGCSAIMHCGQVIMIGQDASDLLTDDPSEFLEQNEEDGGWGKEQMNKSEKAALDKFVSNFERPEDED